MTAMESTLVKKVAEKVVDALEQEQWCEDDRLIRIRIKKGPGSKASKADRSRKTRGKSRRPKR